MKELEKLLKARSVVVRLSALGIETQFIQLNKSSAQDMVNFLVEKFALKKVLMEEKDARKKRYELSGLEEELIASLRDCESFDVSVTKLELGVGDAGDIMNKTIEIKIRKLV